MGSSQLSNPGHVPHKWGLNFLLLYTILIVPWFIYVIGTSCCKLERADLSLAYFFSKLSLPGHRMRSFCYFCCICCISVTLLLVCRAMKISIIYCYTLVPTVRHSSSMTGEGNIIEYMGKGLMIGSQTSESFEHVFIHRKRLVVHRQTTQLGLEGHFIFFLDMDVCVESGFIWGASQWGRKWGWLTGLFGMVPRGLVLDPDLFWRLNWKQCNRWCKNVQRQHFLLQSTVQRLTN